MQLFSMYGFNSYAEEYQNCQKGPVWNQVSSSSENSKKNSNFNNKYFPFPIFFIQNSTHINKIKNCYQSTKSKDHKCTIRMKSRQHASKNTKSCMSNQAMNVDGQQRCKPLGGTSFYSQILYSNTKDQTDKSQKLTENTIFVTTKIDSKNIFWELAPGQGQVVGNLVVLLATIKNLGRIFKYQGSDEYDFHGENDVKNLLEKQIAFSFLDGENYGYISSSKFAYDMKNGTFPQVFQNLNSQEREKEEEIVEDEGETSEMEDDEDFDRPFPIKLENLDTIFELGEIYPIFASDQKFYLHSDQVEQADSNIKSSESATIQNLITNAAIDIPDLKIEQPNNTASPLPPSSIHSFKRERKESQGILLTDFQTVYKNKFIGSTLDIFTNQVINEKVLNDENLEKFYSVDQFYDFIYFTNVWGKYYFRTNFYKC